MESDCDKTARNASASQYFWQQCTVWPADICNVAPQRTMQADDGGDGGDGDVRGCRRGGVQLRTAGRSGGRAVRRAGASQHSPRPRRRRLPNDNDHQRGAQIGHRRRSAAAAFTRTAEGRQRNEQRLRTTLSGWSTACIYRQCTIYKSAGSGVVRIDPLRFLAGCRKRRLNQALSVLSLRLDF